MIKLLLFTLVAMLLIAAVQQADATHQQTTVNGLTTVTLHEPKIQDSNGQWKDYIFTTTDTSYIFESAKAGSFVFDRNTCRMQIYDAGKISQNTKLFDNFEFILKEALNNTDIWTSQSLGKCNTSIAEQYDGIVITARRDSTTTVNQDHLFANGTTKPSYRTGGIFEIKISTVGGLISSEAFYTNHDDIKDNTHKYMATYILDGNIKKIKYDNSTKTKDFTLTKDNITDHRFTMSVNNVEFEVDNSEAENLAWAYKLENTKFMADFGNVKEPLKKGQTISLDPVFNFKKGGVHRVITSSSADTNCNSGSTKDQTAILHKEDSATSGNCRYIALEIDMTTMPAGQNLRTATLSTTVNTVTNGINCDITPVTNRPSTTAASTLATDINDGTPYSNNNSWCTSTGQKSIALVTTFADTCETNYSNGWCALGITF